MVRLLDQGFICVADRKVLRYGRDATYIFLRYNNKRTGFFSEVCEKHNNLLFSAKSFSLVYNKKRALFQHQVQIFNVVALGIVNILTSGEHLILILQFLKSNLFSFASDSFKHAIGLHKTKSSDFRQPASSMHKMQRQSYINRFHACKCTINFKQPSTRSM